jgi:hypothetical protein
MIRQTIRQYLIGNKGRYKEIGAELGIDPDWISKFARGARVDCYASRCEKLWQYMEANGWEYHTSSRAHHFKDDNICG